jgi:hypothetical protein
VVYILMFSSAILRAHTPLVSPPPVNPSLLPAWPERRVRHVLRLPALPATRAGLLQLRNAMCSATMRPLLACLMGHTPRTSPHMRYRARTSYHPHALSTRPPCTPDTTRSRRCPSSTRAPPSLTPQTQQRSSVRPFPIPYAHFLASARDGRSGPAPLSPRRRPLSTCALGRISITAPTPLGNRSTSSRRPPTPALSSSPRHAPRVITATIDARVRVRTQRPACAHR